MSSAPGLREHLLVVRRRKLVAASVFLLVFGAGVAAQAVMRPTYRTTAKLLVPVTSAKMLNAGARASGDGGNPVSTMLAAAQPNSIQTQIEEIRSDLFLNEVKRDSGLEGDESWVKVAAVADSDVIEVRVEGRDPSEITRLANAVVEMHVERSDRSQEGILGEAIGIVQSERDSVQERLALNADRLTAVQTVQLQLERYAHRESEREKQYLALQALVQDAAATEESSRQQLARLNREVEAEPRDLVQERVTSNPQRARLEERVRELRLKRIELLEQVTPENPEVEDLDLQIGALEGQLRQEPETLVVKAPVPNPTRTILEPRVAELRATLVRSEETHRALRESLASWRGGEVNLAAGRVRLDALTRERDRLQNRFDLLSERLAELQSRRTAKAPAARVIEWAAIPDSPIAPNKPFLLVLALTAALASGIGAAFLKEHLDDCIRSPYEVEQLSRLPTLARVPMLTAGNASLTDVAESCSPGAEAYRMLRSSLRFASWDSPLRCIQVTSANEGEGKTITSINLATAIALEGRRVLLVDADLRRPRIHQLMELQLRPGLAEVLAGEKALEDAIHPTKVKNLRVLPAGRTAMNPAELLDPSRLVDFMAAAAEQADIVILDSSPCLPVTDPVILSTYVDGVLLVTRSGRTQRVELMHVVELLQRAQARVLGTVYNGARDGEGGLGYYQYYGTKTSRAGSGTSSGAHDALPAPRAREKEGCDEA
jgi:polysaccharide biosynthesis transport protein